MCGSEKGKPAANLGLTMPPTLSRPSVQGFFSKIDSYSLPELSGFGKVARVEELFPYWANGRRGFGSRTRPDPLDPAVRPGKRPCRSTHFSVFSCSPTFVLILSFSSPIRVDL